MGHYQGQEKVTVKVGKEEETRHAFLADLRKWIVIQLDWRKNSVVLGKRRELNQILNSRTVELTWSRVQAAG